MVQLRTTILAYLHISLVLALVLIDVKPLIAQQQSITSFLQKFDAELSIPEDDIHLINEILKGLWQPGKDLAKQIAKLSIIDYDDEKILLDVKNTKSFQAISKQDGISAFLSQLLEIIEQNTLRYEELGDLLVNQYMVINDDYRYRWKINYRNSNYSIGLIAERDPDEQKILDHVSGYFAKEFSASELIIGDYQIVSGFGLWSWRSVATRKSFETLAGLPRIGRGIAPYRSSNEAWYLRGIGYTKNTNYGHWLISGGYTKQDGRIDSEGKIARSFSGLHTGATSIEQANNITESVIIGQWNYLQANTNIVTSLSSVNWSDKSNLNKKDWNGSLAFDQKLKTVNLFGEVGRGYENTAGMIAGLRFKFPSVKYIASSRYYSNGYSALRSNPFAEWLGKDRNEYGLFQSISFKQNRNLFIAYGDIFRSAKAKQDDAFPQSGQEVGIRLENRKGQKYQKIQWKWEKKSLESEGYYLLNQQSDYEISNTLKYSGVFNINVAIWGKLQLTYSYDETNLSNSKAYGLDTQIWWKGENIAVFFDVVTTATTGGTAWIYFWDVNLPGEMTTRVYTKDGISPAIKVLYQTNSGFELGARVRAQWNDFDFSGTPEIFGALVLEVLL